MVDSEAHRKLVQEDAIDETPISPVTSRDPVRRNSLELHLQNRPHREDLVDSASPRPYSSSPPSRRARPTSFGPRDRVWWLESAY